MERGRNDEFEFPVSVKTGLNAVKKRLSSFKSSDFVNSELQAPSVHLFSRKGKLMRPTLVLLSAYFIGEDPKKYIDLAVAAELIHTSSLIHDDIIDRDEWRGRIPTVHRTYGNEVALLAGDALISKAVSMSAKYGERVMNIMARSSMEMCAGEILDYSFQKSGKVPNLEEYMDIINLKSASLIAACCNAVAIHRNSVDAKKLYLFGKDIGMAFQIRDDIIDYIAWKPNGKTRLIPNIISSLTSRGDVGRYSAILKARELNQKYMRSASKRLGDRLPAKLIKNYADRIMRDI